MTKTATLRATRAIVPDSCARLARSRNLKHLWIARMLVHLGDEDALSNGRCNAEIERLGLFNPPPRDKVDEFRKWRADMRLALEYMEARARQFKLNRILGANLDLLSRQFSLTRAERLVLALVIFLKTDDIFSEIASHTRDITDMVKTIGRVLRLPAGDIREAISGNGRLCKCGLLNNDNDRTSFRDLRFYGTHLPLESQRLTSLEALFADILRIGPAATLRRDDYAHLNPGIDFVLALLKEARQSKRRGVNVLLHGAPGTGKTECVRLLARELALPLYEIPFMDSDGDSLAASERLQAAMTVQILLKKKRALLMFDEVDAVFNDGSWFSGKLSTAEESKAWVNDLLEQNPMPMIWIANRVRGMDPAFTRRFDLVLELEAPPLRQRERLLEKLCGESLDAGQIRRFAQVEAATPTVITRAVNVVRRVECPEHTPAELLETVLDGTLRAQGQASVRHSCRGMPADAYDISLCNADLDLAALAAGIARTGRGRICMYGPPGTGKTAFGHWLAKTLDRPLVLKRISDIQSPYVGEMEQNLARAFAQAERERALLQIDEVDTWLQDRRSAQRQWEISQTNEFLTQLEAFDGVFIASTNLMEGLDQAALRRFDYKIRADYMRPEQAQRMLERLLDDWRLPAPDAENIIRLKGLPRLTPGDFALIRRRHAVTPFADAGAVLDALRQEILLKQVEPRTIGFV